MSAEKDMNDRMRNVYDEGAVYDEPTPASLTRYQSINMVMLSVSVILSGTLFLVMVVIAGLLWNLKLPVFLAIADLGVNYIAATVQLASPSSKMATLILLALSIVLGVCAGIYLMKG